MSIVGVFQILDDRATPKQPFSHSSVQLFLCIWFSSSHQTNLFPLCLHLVISFAEKWELLKCGLFLLMLGSFVCCFWGFFCLVWFFSWLVLFLCLFTVSVSKSNSSRWSSGISYPQVNKCIKTPENNMHLCSWSSWGNDSNNLCLFQKSNKLSSTQW